MELIIAFLMTLFSFNGDSATYQDAPNTKSEITTDFAERPDPGKVDGPIIIIEDIHFKPRKQ